MPPDPAGGWSRACLALKDAIAIPQPAIWRANGLVLDSAGKIIPQASLWRNEEELPCPEPEITGPMERLEGRYLWLGPIVDHFGHLLTEGLSRLWALDVAGGDFDGLLYVSKRPGPLAVRGSLPRRIFRLFGVKLPLIAVREPTLVSELVVPGQGLGLGEIAKGTPEMHAFARRALARIAPETGTPRIYLSRSQLTGTEGRVLAERILEQNFAASGYSVVHPQTLPLDRQVALYKGAAVIVGSEGSALHLAALAAGDLQRAAVIYRRKSHFGGSLVDQLDAFTGARTIGIDAVRAIWSPKHSGRSTDFRTLAELDFAALREGLVASGFIAEGAPWRLPEDEDLLAELDAADQASGQPLMRYDAEPTGISPKPARLKLS